ncbi:Adenosylmethionine-8-amino-7-oxononanoate aminotransferase [Moritella viscosa]|uniref:adenosylmethionine--8-amino-7-oxononanoate transaminase n=1 Tax=Moritella viscosa TaxID=80854 RepID=UPI00050921B7|nr:adenosylmethionine--8-amino-7-oxononanoate transaminase [Moritella viscosa]CED59890.1 adenosylmethionine-8-amino-7-oxononanoate aminotransferase [Moritella viscosa]SGY90503.1 Adenosylmethionine-8-amino-7-oxononanoate aminotransferase [Moritella viscosa]SHO03747.1 Adenosylmethionine-8-amino-7-oxononanoate aminotransferase [Moritella viscosa]SHO21000.1 Adenosylmethionine-8-amino-7-oxononanoate aminotransferase [Moritella viscosa]
MTQKTNKNLVKFDQQHIWHPYTSMTKPLPCYHVDSAEGVYLTLNDGTRLIDGMSSWWASIHGYNVPALNQAMQKQASKMSHVMFGGITHEPAINLCQKLVDITPDGLECVFLSDSGSVSVEVAMKMAIQYWHHQQPAKKKFVTIRNGYHGDTFGAMSVCDPDNGMHELFTGFLAPQFFISAPSIKFNEQWQQSAMQELEQALVENHQHIAALILEPIVQGAGGMKFYHPEFLRQAKLLCEHYKVLLIADEIATGFGRTGKLFACEHAGITPDIMCLGKGITGGYMTLAATLTTRHVAETISNGPSGVLMHGPTFMGNPLACAVANASIDLLMASNWQQQVKRIEDQLQQTLLPLVTHKNVADTRVLGSIGVIETKQAIDLAKAQVLFVELGVWIRPFGKLLYIMPPYIISNSELTTLCHVIRQVLDADIWAK